MVKKICEKLIIIAILIWGAISSTGCAILADAIENGLTAGASMQRKAFNEGTNQYNKIITSKKDDIRGEITTTQIEIIVHKYFSENGYLITQSSVTFYKIEQGNNTSYYFLAFLNKDIYKDIRVGNLLVKMDELLYTLSVPTSQQSNYFNISPEMVKKIKNCKTLSIQFIQKHERIGEEGLAKIQSIIE
jgi:hypothetical protein